MPPLLHPMFRVLVIVVGTVVVTAVCAGASRVRTTPGMSFHIADAKQSWRTGESRVFTPFASVCEEYRVTLIVGARFVSLAVTNPNVCGSAVCDPADYDSPGCKWSEFAPLAPFEVSFVDTSTAVPAALPTTQSAPDNVPTSPPLPTMLMIPEALDRTLLTDSMDVRIVLFGTRAPEGGIANSTVPVGDTEETDTGATSG